MRSEARGPGCESVSPGDSWSGLVAGLRRGDPGAFAEIYRRFAPIVHGIALAYVDPGEAEDLVHDVFLSVRERIGSLAQSEALPRWISAIARNRALDRVRRRGWRFEPLPEDLHAHERPGGGELRERVLRHVRSLPSAYRETLILRLIEGLSGPEIARRTGLTPGSVRVNLHRGMQRLRERLEKEGWQ